MIDLVYTWCDSADRIWNAKREAAAKACGLSVGSAANAECRFVGNDEIRFSLRSAERCVPWVRTVFLVIDDDITPPAWLRLDHPKLRIVRLSEIMPSKLLPCFCSGTIEHHLARIPDLAERFIYANDDMMFYRPLKPSFFFAADGYPKFRFGGEKEPLPDEEKTNYHLNIEVSDALARREYGLSCKALNQALARYPHHCVDAYRKSDLLACYARFAAVLEKSFDFPFRSPDKVQRIIYAYDAIANGHGHFRPARFRIGGGRPWYKRLLRPGWADTLQFYGSRWRTGLVMLEKWRPGAFCFNDTLDVTDADRQWLRSVYEGLFPGRSTFEKEEA